ncbi:hypothetical protein PHSC3_000172 [Chlamydiales bacterium STE3]|nr:hypothetical protein PHSC3_000172 [Chlamydiales bacterium STE3]
MRIPITSPQPARRRSLSELSVVINPIFSGEKSSSSTKTEKIQAGTSPSKKGFSFWRGGKKLCDSTEQDKSVADIWKKQLDREILPALIKTINEISESNPAVEREAISEYSNHLKFLLDEVYTIKASFADQIFYRSATIEIPALTNEMVQRNWFPGPRSIPDEVYFNDERIDFLSCSESATAKEEKECIKENLKILIQTLFAPKEVEQEVEKILNPLSRNHLCHFSELCLQSIEACAPILNDLSRFFHQFKNTFRFKTGRSDPHAPKATFICRYEKKGQAFEIQLERNYELYCNNDPIGFFHLKWQFKKMGESHEASELCECTPITFYS